MAMDAINMNKIKIAYILGSLNRGGAQKILLDICNNISKDKFDISVIYWRDGDFSEEFKKIKSIKLMKLKNSHLRIEGGMLNEIPSLIRRANELIKIQKAERF